jgi:hypothetical protein
MQIDLPDPYKFLNAGGHAHKNNLHTGELIDFYKTESDKTPFRRIVRAPLTSKVNNDMVTYKVNHKYSYLKATTLSVSTPEILAREGYEFRFTANLITNIIEDATFRLGDQIFPRLNNIILDVCQQYFNRCDSADKKEIDAIYRGNLDLLTDWSSEKASFDLRCRLPWFYDTEETAFPLFYNDKHVARHIFKFRLGFRHLIQIRDKESKILVSPRDLEKYLYLSNDACLDVPKLVGTYSIVDENTIAELLRQDKIVYNLPAFSSFVCDKKIISSEIEIELGNDNPCFGLFWMIRNLSASENNYYSNYTTNAEDLTRGEDPIKHQTLIIDDAPFFFQEKSTTFSVDVPNDHCLSNSLLQGYHVWSFSDKLYNIDSQCSILLPSGRAKLSIKLKEGTINIDAYESSSRSLIDQQLYKLVIVYFIMRKLVISRDGDKFKYEVLSVLR